MQSHLIDLCLRLLETLALLPRRWRSARPSRPAHTCTACTVHYLPPYYHSYSHRMVILSSRPIAMLGTKDLAPIAGTGLQHEIWKLSGFVSELVTSPFQRNNATSCTAPCKKRCKEMLSWLIGQNWCHQVEHINTCDQEESTHFLQKAL